MHRQRDHRYCTAIATIHTIAAARFVQQSIVAHHRGREPANRLRQTSPPPTLPAQLADSLTFHRSSCTIRYWQYRLISAWSKYRLRQLLLLFARRRKYASLCATGIQNTSRFCGLLRYERSLLAPKYHRIKKNKTELEVGQNSKKQNA